jgi:hypothetical protein
LALRNRSAKWSQKVPKKLRDSNVGEELAWAGQWMTEKSAVTISRTKEPAGGSTILNSNADRKTTASAMVRKDAQLLRKDRA